VADKRKRQPGPISVILRFFDPRKIARLSGDPARQRPAVPFESRQMRPAGKPEVAPGGSTKFAEQPDIRIITRKKKQ